MMKMMLQTEFKKIKEYYYRDDDDDLNDMIIRFSTDPMSLKHGPNDDDDDVEDTIAKKIRRSVDDVVPLNVIQGA